MLHKASRTSLCICSKHVTGCESLSFLGPRRYQSQQFWADLKHLESGPEGVKVRVVLARTHGAGRSHASSSASQHDADRCTPIGTDKADMNVTILPSSAGGISIQLSRSEIDELWSSWLGNVMQRVPIGAVIRNWVYSICAGQVRMSACQAV